MPKLKSVSVISVVLGSEHEIPFLRWIPGIPAANCRASRAAPPITYDERWAKKKKRLAKNGLKYCIYVQYSVTMGHPSPEHIHPSLWTGSQLARPTGRVIDTGYAALSAELPGGGWPVSTLIELLLQQVGVGEIRLLRPALASLTNRPIAPVHPPHVPNGVAFSFLGIDPSRLVRINAPKSSDALWATEQILRADSFAAVLLWQAHVRAESLRRLLLAAQTSQAMFFVVRPISQTADPSPAALRLGIRPHAVGLSVEIAKRKGPSAGEPILISLDPSPNLISSVHRHQRKGTAEPIKVSPIDSQPSTVD